MLEVVLHRENPAEVLPEIDTRRSGVETFVAHSSSMLDIAGYDYPVSYASDPQSDYQARLRCSKRVGHHYTPIFSSYVIERYSLHGDGNRASLTSIQDCKHPHASWGKHKR